jgi:hypothetical protein
LRSRRKLFGARPKDQDPSVDPYLVFVADEVRKGRAVSGREVSRVETDNLQVTVRRRRAELIKKRF